jgi:hypothetical protein
MALSKLSIQALFDLQGFSSSAQNLERKMKKTAKKLESVGKQMSFAVSAPLIGLGALAVKSAADIETLKTSLQTALGSTAEEANNVYRGIEAFASRTPYAIQEVTEGFIKLKNMGLDPSMEALKSYGNTAAAMGKPLNQMVEAVADAAVGEFERLKEFGIKAKSEGDNVSFTFKGVTTTIGKNAAEIEEYLQNIGNVEFAGGIEKQSKTFNGVMSTLRDNVGLAAASFGELMLPVLKRVSDAILTFTQFIRNLNPQTKKWIIGIGALLAALGPLLVALGGLVSLLPAIGAGIAAIFSPVTLVIGGLAALATAFIYVKDNLGAFSDFFYNVWTGIKNFFIEALKNMLGGFKVLTDVLGLDIGDNLFSFLDGLKSKTKENTREFGTLKDAFKNTFMSVQKDLKDAAIGDVFENKVVNPIVKGTDKAVNAISKIPKAIEHSLEPIKNVKFPMPTIDVNTFVSGIGNAKRKALHVFEQIGQDISLALNQGIQSLATNAASLIGEFLGSALSGADVSIKDFGKGFLAMVGNFMTQFGEAMVAIGVAQAMVDLAIKSMNPALAIAGGIALIAAGAALSNIASKGVQGGGGMAMNNTNFGSGGFRPEMQNIVMESTIKGREIVLVQRRENSYRR